MKDAGESEQALEQIEPAAILAQQQGAPFEAAATPVRAGSFDRVLSNAGANIARQASAFLVVLVLPPLLVRSLDQSTYAVWLLVLQITSYITLIDNGIQAVVARYVALERVTTGTAGVARVITNAAVLLGMVAGVTLVVFAVGSSALSWLLPRQPSTLLLPAKHALMITAATAALALPFSALAGMFTGDQRSGVNALVSTAGKLVGAAAVAWAAMEHRGLEAMAAALAGGTLLQSLLYVGAARWRSTTGLFAWRLVERSYLRELFTFSTGMMISQLAGLLIAGLDLPIVSRFDFKETAYYGLALTASNLLLIPFAAVVTAFMPVVTAIHAERNPWRLGEVLGRITRYANNLLGVLVLTLGLSLPALLRWWIRPGYAEHVLPLAEILMVSQAVRLSCSPYSIAGFSAGKQKQMLSSPVGEGVVNLVCSYLGARWLGAAGVAWGSLVGAVAGVLLHLLVNVPRTQDVLRFDRWSFVRDSMMRPWMAALSGLPVFFALYRWATTPVRTLALSLVCGLIAAAVSWQWGLDAEDRRRIARKLRRRA